MTNKPHVKIIILNWNGIEDTLACLNSLENIDYPTFEVIIVDNASVDDSVARIRELYPEVTIIENEKNLGYAGGNNVGLRWALRQEADYILLLNNDTEVAPDFLSRIIEVMEKDPSIGIVGPTIYFYDHPNVIWSAGGSIDWRTGQTWMLSNNEQDDEQSGGTPREVEFVSGCAMLVRRNVLNRIGMLDERFFLYYEEAEWCVRASKAGFRIFHVPQSKIWHKIRQDIQDYAPHVVYYSGRNRLLFLRSCGISLWRVLLVILLFHLRVTLSWTVLPRHHDKLGLRKFLMKSAHDFLKGQFGPVSREIFVTEGS